MKYSNIELEKMAYQLKGILPQRNKIGYIAARNMRIINNALTEYYQFKNQLIEKYGEVDKDKDGTPLSTVTLKFDSPKFKQFTEEFSEFMNIEQDIQLMLCKYEEVIGILNGEEILALSWMLED